MTCPVVDEEILSDLNFAPSCGVVHKSVPNGCDNPATHIVTIHGCAVSAGPDFVTVPICTRHLEQGKREWEVCNAAGFSGRILCHDCETPFNSLSDFIRSVVPL